MKKLTILLTTMSFVLMSAPIMADDSKKSRISGVKSSEKYDRSSRRDSNKTQRREQRTNRNDSHRSDKRQTQRKERRTNRNDGHHSDRRRSDNRSNRNASNHNRSDRNASNHNRKSTKHQRQNRRNAHNNRHGSSHRYRGYRNNGRYSAYYNNHHRKHRKHYRSDRYGYLLGGVILGSVLANSNHRHTAYCDHDYDYRYDNSSRVITTRVVSDGTYGRSDDVHLFRDRNGDCFEVFENRSGDEVREEIDPSYCEW